MSTYTIRRAESDPNSYANNLVEAAVSHFHLNLTADFKSNTLAGHIDLDVTAVKEGAAQIVLDSKALTITKAVAVVDSKEADTLTFALAAEDEVFGQALTVTFASPAAKDSTLKIRIYFSTSPDATGVQWLPASQTAGKEHPYLFTQFQAIHARSCFPCQDSPSNKSTYSAEITVPAPLVALMSAAAVDSPVTADGVTVYKFNQPVVMPSYLVALAIGALEKRDIGPRSAVWSEKEFVDAGAKEFEDTEAFLTTAEKICGPYVWGRYDILLLPPSFPYGGMENPCLTFVTPTLLAGDKSLSNVVAHEIAHSWHGNLITCKNWEHFWLNEGFTVYVERKIEKALHGEDAMHLAAAIGYKALEGSVSMFPGDHSFTTLIPDLKNVDPDDAFSSVPYERGFNLLFYLETLIGEANMTKFLPLFCDKFKHKTLDSFDFIDFLNATFPEEKAKLDTIDWETWLYKPGMPPANVFNDNLLNGSKALAQVFVDAKGADPTDPADISGWNAQQQVVFLEHAQKLFTTENDEAKEDAEAQAAVRAKYQKICGALDKAYNFSSTKNSEILFRYLGLCLFAHLESAFPAVVLMATSQGRMKFTRPLYRGLFAAGETGKALAIATFTEHKSFYNAICAKMVAKDLGQ